VGGESDVTDDASGEDALTEGDAGIQEPEDVAADAESAPEDVQTTVDAAEDTRPDVAKPEEVAATVDAKADASKGLDSSLQFDAGKGGAGGAAAAASGQAASGCTAGARGDASSWGLAWLLAAGVLLRRRRPAGT
jgi:MYXO-CTERM domain-containing protein